MKDPKQYGIFEQVEFLNEGAVGAGILLTLGGIALASEIKKKINEHKGKKSGTQVSEKEYDKIMKDFKSLAKSLDAYRYKVAKYEFLKDDQPDFKLSDAFFNIFDKNFNKGNSIQPFYHIIFSESDYNYNKHAWEDSWEYFEGLAAQFCKENGFKDLDDEQNHHRYLRATSSSKYEGFVVEFYADTHFELCIEYDKKVIKEKK